jgi:hypothetical protein
MTNLKTVIIAAIIVTVSFAILSFEGYSLNEIIAEELSEDKGYLFAEDTVITGMFDFSKGTEISRFEIFTQNTGFKARDKFAFTLEKIVGETPLLHEVADHDFLYRNSAAEKKDDNTFDVKIIISQGKDQKRSFSYSNCFIKDYFVVTKTDNEEGWFSKGFAVVDHFEIQCGSYQPNNPVYEEMTAVKEIADAKSSIDYQSEQKKMER